jgi:hypothetical protein
MRYSPHLACRASAGPAGAVCVQAWGRSRWRRQLVGSSSGSQAGTHDQFGFVVDDLDAEVARLRAEGVQFNSRRPPGATTRDAIMDRGDVKAGWFRTARGT